MRYRWLLFIWLGLIVPISAHAQECPERLSGAWTTTLPIESLFELQIEVRYSAAGWEGGVRSSLTEELLSVWEEGAFIRFHPESIPLSFKGQRAEDGSALHGFFHYGANLAHVTLPASVEGDGAVWRTTWSPLGIGEEEVQFDLYIGDDGAGGMGGYFFFRDQRLPGLWGEGVRCNGSSITLRERNLDLDLQGEYNPPSETLSLTASGLGGSTQLTFHRMPEADIPSFSDQPLRPPRIQPVGNVAAISSSEEWPAARLAEAGLDAEPLNAMVADIESGELMLTHGVLVARHGKLVVEEYFYGYNQATWHDMRSASKTVASMLVGLAIEEGHIEHVEQPALSFFPHYRSYANWDPRKAQITLHDLMAMSSGLDANDSNWRSVANEGNYQSQTAQPDWVKYALDAPMVDDPGRQPMYGSANPLIVGGILAHALDEPVEWFAHRALFAPLGISSYEFHHDPAGVVYMGGGLYLRPRDMLKLGQWYLDDGVWNGQRLLPDGWVEASWGQYGQLRPLEFNGHQYGYLWWHHVYEVGGKQIQTLEARGNGGQYIFVIPSLDMVVVITAGNYRTGRTRQPETILQEYILPAVIE